MILHVQPFLHWHQSELVLLPLAAILALAMVIAATQRR